MKITRSAVAGTLESSDVFVTVAPSEDGLSIHIESVVYDQFSELIRAAASETLTRFHVNNAVVSLNDRGALDCTIRARVETAIRRAGKGEG